MYRATEFDIESGDATGHVESYMAESIHDAVTSVLYTRQLANGEAQVGPSGRVVHAGALAWAVTDDD